MEKFCAACKMQVDDKEPECPVCQSTLTDRATFQAIYPPVKKVSKKKKGK